jgi:hypothetical protein
MTAEQWLDWAMDQQPRGKNSLSAAQREWSDLIQDPKAFDQLASQLIKFDLKNHDNQQ